jgi:hypothetical protein
MPAPLWTPVFLMGPGVRPYHLDAESLARLLALAPGDKRTNCRAVHAQGAPEAWQMECRSAARPALAGWGLLMQGPAVSKLLAANGIACRPWPTPQWFVT